MSNRTDETQQIIDAARVLASVPAYRTYMALNHPSKADELDRVFDSVREDIGRQDCTLFVLLLGMLKSIGCCAMDGSPSGKISGFDTYGGSADRKITQALPYGPGVYALYGPGALAPFYIGKSVSMPNRLDHHRNKWKDRLVAFEAAFFTSTDEMEMAEADLIAMFRPHENRQIFPCRYPVFGVDEAIDVVLSWMWEFGVYVPIGESTDELNRKAAA